MIHPHHLSLRERLLAHEIHEPVFEASDDPVLVAFGRLFVASELSSFDANKHLRTDALSPIYDCWTESRPAAGEPIDRFVVIWTPVWDGISPVTGFRVGQDSALLGSTPTVAMPQDERTDALLMLVTSTYVHLSGRRADGELVVEGALESDQNSYRFVRLEPAALAAATGDLAAPAPVSGPADAE